MDFPGPAEVQRRAEVILAGVRGQLPPHLATPEFEWPLQSWAQAEARVQMMRDALDGLPDGQMYLPQRPGGDCPLGVWVKLARHALNLRRTLGLSDA